jgi:4'-phosphopantetheinyl transferase
MIHISVSSIAEIQSAGFERESLLLYLPQKSRQRLSLITNPESFDRSLLGELLTRYCIVRYALIPYEQIDFSYGEKGKPLLPQFPNVFFNMSHSAQMVACAMAETEIGIDVEHFRNVNFRVAERFFSAAEIADLLALHETERNNYFFTLWTIKESFLKAIGSGLTKSLNSFTVRKSGENYCLSGDGIADQYSIKTYLLDDHYFLASCCKEPFFPAKAEKTGIMEIVEFLAYLE